MNLRPSGYEPDELPDCSTPRPRLKIMTDRPIAVKPTAAFLSAGPRWSRPVAQSPLLRSHRFRASGSVAIARSTSSPAGWCLRRPRPAGEAPAGLDRSRRVCWSSRREQVGPHGATRGDFAATAALRQSAKMARADSATRRKGVRKEKGRHTSASAGKPLASKEEVRAP